MEPATASLVLQGGSSIIGGLSGSQQAKAEKRQAEINSFIARTRALQTDAVNRENLERDLGTYRAALSANGETPSVGSLEILRELRRTRNRENSIEYGNRRQEAFAFDRRARNADIAARGAMIGGLLGAGPSVFDLVELRRSRTNGSTN